MQTANNAPNRTEIKIYSGHFFFSRYTVATVTRIFFLLTFFFDEATQKPHGAKYFKLLKIMHGTNLNVSSP
jgi:hypothetical protein